MFSVSASMLTSSAPPWWIRQPSSAGRQIAIRDNSNRRATCRASASMAPVVSVVSSTSRVRSKSRVTSLRRAIASRARSCAAADRLLAMTATTRNANRAIQFCGSAMVKVPTGGRKKKLRSQHRRNRRHDRDRQTADRCRAEDDEQKRQRDSGGADVREQPKQKRGHAENSQAGDQSGEIAHHQAAHVHTVPILHHGRAGLRSGARRRKS